MLKFIDLKKITAFTFMAIFSVGLAVQPTVASRGNSNGNGRGNSSSCNSNNGHGNNAATNITLNDGTRIIGTYDPSNPGNSARNRLTVTKNGSNISLSGEQLAELNTKVNDVELLGRGSGNSSECSDGGYSDSDNDGIYDIVENLADLSNVDEDDINNYSNGVDSSVSPANTSDSVDSAISAPDKITLTGTLRDFDGYRDKNGNINSDGHEDFERKDNVDENPGGQKFRYGLDTGITTDTLGADKKPVYAGGSYSTTTKENFDQWYRDVRGVNQSTTHDIVLNKKPGTNIYSFDNNGEQFFPLDGQLMGNEGRSHNFHFTYEIHTEFTYRGGETFNFSGDDDVWVYIDGRKVIDIGGVHGKTDASVNLDSLGLTPGETYDLDFFFAERHVTQSNFKIETTIELEAAPDPNADEDGDGIPNILEGFETEVDSDGDGIADYLDDDSDNNGIPDSDEVGTISDPSDSDGDNIPNFQDDDDDGNGILDVDEIGNNKNKPTNTDGTDLPDYQDTDDDNDGILDIVEMGDDPINPTNTDETDEPDYHDDDSDNDGIPDSVETADDFDGDGTPNFQDDDSDNDTIPDSVETANDSELDDDSDPNFLDLDSDGDGIPDENEEVADSNDEGDETDVTDSDLDDDGTTNNVDGDDKDNYLDEDSDNDGFNDDIDPEPYIPTYAD